MNAREDVSPTWRPRVAGTERPSVVVMTVFWVLRTIGVGVAIVAAIVIVVNGFF